MIPNPYKDKKAPYGSGGDLFLNEIVSQGIISPGKTLDIGGGDGRNAIELAKRGFQVDLLDLSPEAIDQLVQKASQLGLEDLINGSVTDITTFEFPDHEYDLVTCTFVLHFLTPPQFDSILQNIISSLKPGGVAIIADFTNYGPMYKPTTSKRWLSNGELKEIFKKHEILYFKEQLRKPSFSNEKQMASAIAVRKR
jgi:tellurite methyltransferase